MKRLLWGRMMRSRIKQGSKKPGEQKPPVNSVKYKKRQQFSRMIWAKEAERRRKYGDSAMFMKGGKYVSRHQKTQR